MKFRFATALMVLTALSVSAAKEKKAEDYPLRVVVIETHAGSIPDQLANRSCSMTIQADDKYVYGVSSRDWHCKQYDVGTHLLGRLRSVMGVKFIYLALQTSRGIQEAYYEIHRSYYDPHAAPAPAQVVAEPLNEPAQELAVVTVKCSAEAAEIMLDGNFVGNTPSVVKLAPGDHKVTITGKGFKPWERTFTVTQGAAITLNATLEPN